VKFKSIPVKASKVVSVSYLNSEIIKISSLKEIIQRNLIEKYQYQSHLEKRQMMKIGK